MAPNFSDTPDDHDERAYGVGLASMALHQLQFLVLLKAGIVTAGQLREMFESLLMSLEELGPGLAPLTAREQIQSLFDNLDDASIDMRVSRLMRMPGGPEE